MKGWCDSVVKQEKVNAAARNREEAVRRKHARKEARTARRALERQVSKERNESYDATHMLFSPEEMTGMKVKKRKEKKKKRSGGEGPGWMCENCGGGPYSSYKTDTQKQKHKKGGRCIRMTAARAATVETV